MHFASDSPYHPGMQPRRTSTAPQPPPSLAPPGAGIPTIERLIGGTIFALKRWRGTPTHHTARFNHERAAIAQLCAGKSDETLSRRILIPRLRGLEDSSRYWSVWMTLDHLRIVNTQIANVIDALTRGHAPPGKASTAAVKPRESVDAHVLRDYNTACDHLIAVVESKPNLRTTIRFAHPWFGPLDAAGWHAMAAMHMGIHRAQIDRILRTNSTFSA